MIFVTWSCTERCVKLGDARIETCLMQRVSQKPQVRTDNPAERVSYKHTHTPTHTHTHTFSRTATPPDSRTRVSSSRVNA